MSHQYYFPLVLRPYIRKVNFSAPQIVRHVYRKSKRIAIIITFEVTEYCKLHIICLATNWFYFLIMKYRCIFHHNWVHHTATFSAQNIHGLDSTCHGLCYRTTMELSNNNDIWQICQQLTNLNCTCEWLSILVPYGKKHRNIGLQDTSVSGVVSSSITGS